MDTGGRRQPGSGSQWHAKGDTKSADWLIECKFTDKDQYALKLSVLKSHGMRAILEGKKPLLQIEFGAHRYAVVSWEIMLEMMNEQSSK